jgi:hypothetical protein
MTLCMWIIKTTTVSSREVQSSLLVLIFIGNVSKEKKEGPLPTGLRTYKMQGLIQEMGISPLKNYKTETETSSQNKRSVWHSHQSSQRRLRYPRWSGVFQRVAENPEMGSRHAHVLLSVEFREVKTEG